MPFYQFAEIYERKGSLQRKRDLWSRRVDRPQAHGGLRPNFSHGVRRRSLSASVLHDKSNTPYQKADGAQGDLRLS